MLTIDADSERVIFGPGATSEVTTIKGKRRLVAALNLQFSRGNTVIALPNDAAGEIEFKLPGRFDTQPITGAAAWTKLTGDDGNVYYRFLFGLISPTIDRLFGFDEPVGFTVTAASDLINAPAHGRAIGDKLNLYSDDMLPDGLLDATDYFIASDGFGLNSYKVSLSSGGDSVAINDAGTGNHFFVYVTNDVDVLALIADIYWTHSSGTVEGKTQTLNALFENDVTRSGDEIPDTPAIVYVPTTVWHDGNGAPDNSSGIDGDFYVNKLFGSGYFDIYERVSGVYTLIGNIAGKGAGFRYTFKAGTGDPAGGEFSFDNSAFGSANHVKIAEVDKSGTSLVSFLGRQDDSTSTKKCLVIARKVSSDKSFSFFITGTLSDDGIFDTFPIDPIAGSSGISDGDAFELTFIRTGDKGDPGAAGTGGGGGGGGIAPITGPTTEAYTYVSDGDDNGVFNALGTLFGLTPWTNPYLAGRMNIIATDNVPVSIDNKETIVDRADNNYSTSTVTNSIIFDVGESNILDPNFYSYRFRNDQDTFSPDRKSVV